MPARRQFGNVAKLASGRYRVTWKLDGQRFKAPMTFRKKGDANAFLNEMENRLAKGTYRAEPEKETIRSVQFVGQEWLGSNPDKAHATLSRDRSILKMHVFPIMGERDIRGIERHDIEKMVNGWREQSDSAETIRRQYTCMASMFNYAAVNGWIPASPCVKIPLPARVKPAERLNKRRLPSRDEIAAIAQAAGERYEASIWLAAEIGLRWNEVYGLRVGDVDTEGRAVTIDQGITRLSSGASAITEGSVKAKSRTVHISAPLAGILADHIARLDSDDSGAWLFPDSEGGLVRYSNWRSRVWLPALKAAGLDEVTPTPGIHDLRRLAATRMFADGVNLRTVMHRLGHDTAAMALETYARPDAAADQAQADVMGEYLFGTESRVGRAESNQRELQNQ